MNLTSCNISDVDREAFRPLRNLRTLDLSKNTRLGFNTLGDAFYSLQGSALEHLYINWITHPYAICVVIDTNHTRYFKNTKLQSIHVENNRIEIFTPGALDNMPDTLSFVSVSGNRLVFGSYLLELGHLTNLKTVTNDGHLRPPYPPISSPAFSIKPELCESSPYASESERGCHRPLGSDSGEFQVFPLDMDNSRPYD
ncbi:hypothetical protein C0Q70_01083 [Pomacea canaliculata]|uniref:LRRCT domain-containing protein n=1 Tax=Pomacea canaliculata TaxID=400727 RepID=A0A2T7PYI5_POMCA|nr:hypothetical protein C0Q70_01083 [Pomacea canaliculata]